MPYICLVINVPGENIQTLNQQTQFPTKVPESIQGCIDILHQIESGTTAASVQVTTRDTDPAVSTHGSNSQQNTYSHL